jgi:hypothetical protein
MERTALEDAPDIRVMIPVSMDAPMQRPERQLIGSAILKEARSAGAEVLRRSC